ncbi:hypothetical protein niasHT_028695 [Heterodera trifolii]|uniref:Transposase n=1 Tax=Heterodera trifolii TaxID=157864 RepID=A0ABD2JE77_9BILA
MSLTAHGITHDWKRVDFVLSVGQIKGEKTGERIAERIRQILVDWKIPQEKCAVFVRDGGSNMRKAFSAIYNPETFIDSDCSAHLLNLCVKEGLKEERISALLTKCKKIVAHFKHSNTAMGQLREVQLEEDAPTHTLLQEIPVRWNSAFLCRDVIEWLGESPSNDDQLVEEQLVPISCQSMRDGFYQHRPQVLRRNNFSQRLVMFMIIVVLVCEREKRKC